MNDEKCHFCGKQADGKKVLNIDGEFPICWECIDREDDERMQIRHEKTTGCTTESKGA